MGFFNGKLNLTIYRIIGEFPDYREFLERAQTDTALPLDQVKDEMNAGWATGKILLDTALTSENCFVDGHLVLNVRKAQRKIDNGLLKAMIQREITAFKKANGVEFVGHSARKEIKEEMTARLMKQATLAVRGIEAVVDGNLLLIGSQGGKDCDQVAMLLGKQEIAIEQECASNIARRTDPEKFGWTLGRQFLTWLFRADLTHLSLDGPVELIADSGECTQAALRGDKVPISPELGKMLEEKKWIRKARLTLVREPNDIWRCTFDADNWTFGALELPEGYDSFGERIEAIRDFYQGLQTVFGMFLNQYKPEKNDD